MNGFGRFPVAILTTALFVTFIVSACVGAVFYYPDELVKIVARSFLVTPENLSVREFVWLDLRLPRLFLSTLVGASLAAGGVVMQSLFRNPLADPMLVGVSAGAAVAAIVVIVTGLSNFYLFHVPLLQIAAFFGCLITSLAIYQISKMSGCADMYSMLLAGIAFNALATSIIGFFTLVADQMQLRSFIFWMLGSFSGATWEQVGIASVFVLPALAVIIAAARVLDVMTLGEHNATYIGIHVERWKFVLIAAISLCVGVSVSLTGLIAFVGLLAPHLARSLVGASHRYLLPSAILLGAFLVLLADLLARTVLLPIEIPVGIITALLGIPMFLSLVLKRRGSIQSS